MKKKHFILIKQNNIKNRKHIKIKNKKDKSLKKKLKHEPNIVEITHLCALGTGFTLVNSKTYKRTD